MFGWQKNPHARIDRQRQARTMGSVTFLFFLGVAGEVELWILSVDVCMKVKQSNHEEEEKEEEEEGEEEEEEERERERERENSNSKTLFYKDCSLGSVKNLSNN